VISVSKKPTTSGGLDRGQVGIGTLIVFIAMILVAAIAAGVLINTAGSLQSQSSDTGTETQDAIANQIQVVHAVGDINRSDEFLDLHDDPYLEAINLTIMKSPGADTIDLTSMTVQYTSDNVDQTLTYNETHRVTNYESDEYASGWEEFITSETNDESDESLVDTSDRVTITIFARAIEEQSNGDPSSIEGKPGLEPGDSATIKLVDQSGAQFSYGVSTPSTFGDKEVVEV